MSFSRDALLSPSSQFGRMTGRIASLPRMFVLSAVVFIVLCLVYSTSNLSESSRAGGRFKDSIDHSTGKDGHGHPAQKRPSIREAFQILYDAIRLPVDAPSFSDPTGNTFYTTGDGPWWTERLGNEILIVDIDTRVPEGANELWNQSRMNWETLSEGDGGMISASQMNHFLYAQIHGYDYKFFNARELVGLHNTWVKPHVLLDLLPEYKFVVFIDADATWQHLEVPLEWMFNRWGITPETSIAMPLDVRMGEATPEKLEANTGLIVAQALNYTYEMLTAWKDCPDELRYPGCGRWREEWAHEQRAFSQYIRHDFNPNRTNIIEIPCDDAMGFPGIADSGFIADNCTGQFVRHHTIAKGMTKRSTEVAMLQSMTDLLRKELMENSETYLYKEAEDEDDSLILDDFM